MRRYGPPARTFVVRSSILAFCAVLLSACAAANRPEGAGIAVRVTYLEKPLEGVRVTALRSLGDVPAAQGVTGADGRASLAVPPGSYFLVARWRRDGDHGRPAVAGDRFAFFGGNPVHAARGSVREVFMGIEEVLPPPQPPSLPPGTSGAAGRVVSEGAPAEGVRVSAHLSADEGFRDPGVASSAPTGADGGFVLDLPPGRYFLIARRRASGGTAGPMRRGDLFGFFHGNPVDVPEGVVVPVAIPLTRIRLRNVPPYAAERAADAFIEGRIVGRDGLPRKGAHAALYDNPELLGRPVSFSDVTGEDGRYRLPVPLPGTYYLGARTGYGGQPEPGDLYGRYEGNAAHAVTVEEGVDIRGADVVVEEVR